MRRFSIYLLPAVLLVLSLSACQQAGKSGSSTLLAPPDEPVVPAPANISFKGPKRTVAVGNFATTGAFSSKYGSWDVGGGLAAQLATALERSGRFIVLERANLDQIMNEQRLKAQGVTNPETGPELGNLTGVQFLIYGAVTEFGTQEQGRNISVGVSGFTGGLPNPLSGALSHESSSGAVALDIRVVDTSTGQVMETHVVREILESKGLSLTASYSNFSIGDEEFYNTPIGQATRKALTRAVDFITLDAMKTPWMGQVVDVEDGNLIINVGLRAGAKHGDVFSIERTSRQYTDPTTGEVLGSRRERLGTVNLMDVQDKISSGIFTPASNIAPRRGDLVVEQR